MTEPIVSPLPTETHKADKFALVGPGLEVYDSLGQKVGKVDTFYAGSSEQHPVEKIVLAAPLVSSTQQTVAMGEPVLPITKTVDVPEFDSLSHPDEDLPKELRERLAHDGFIAIDAGLLHHHRYALRDQIDRVEGDRVILNVPESELIKH